MYDSILAVYFVCSLGQELAGRFLAQDEIVAIAIGQLVCWVRLPVSELHKILLSTDGRQ